MDAHVEPNQKKVTPVKAANKAMPPGNDMCALGELICRLNPYTKLPPDPATGQQTGGMHIQPPPPSGGLPQGAQPPTIDEIIANLAVEVTRNYGEKWTFKGQAFAVKTAVRIPYRFQVTNAEGETYWQIESLLIGYAGSEGPN
jgi:hypothetical protein